MTDGTRAITASEMAVYVPKVVLGKLLKGVTPRPGQTEIVEGAVLFADLSGLAGAPDDPDRTAWEAALAPESRLATAMSVMIGEVRRFGGSALDVTADSLTAYFPLPPTGLPMEHARTLTTCALVVRDRLARMGNGAMSSVKIGLARGDLALMTVGREGEWLRPVACGAALDMAVMAASVAEPGQIVMDGSVISAFGLHIKGRPLGNGRALLEAIDQMALPRPKAEPELPDWVAEALRAYIPRPVLEVMGGGEGAVTTSGCKATVMVVSVLGPDCSTPHAGSELQRRLERVFEVAGRYGGEVYKIATGVGRCRIHVLFGDSHGPRGDARQDALWCSLALGLSDSDEMPGRKIGLATGEVTAGIIGTETRREYVVLGDPVERASALADLADEWETLTDEGTRVPGARFVFEEVKRPLPTDDEVHRRSYSLVGVHAPLERLWPPGRRPDGPLLGRSDELEAVGEAVESALSGIGGVLEVDGEVGSGKSRLIDEIALMWEEAGGHGFRGHAHPYGAHDPLCAWKGVLEGILGIDPGDPQEIRRDKLLIGSDHLCPDVPDAPALIAPLIGVGIDEPPALGILEPKVRRERLFGVILSMVTTLAGERPLMLILEDMSEADGSSWDLAAYLAGMASELPILLCLETGDGDRERIPGAYRIFLRPLPPESGATLLRELLGADEVPAQMADVLAGGRGLSPLLIEMAARHVLDVGGLPEGLDPARTTPSEMLREVFFAGLERLDGHSRELLNIASVIGIEVPFDVLRDVYPYPIGAEALGELLDGLGRRGIMRGPIARTDEGEGLLLSRVDRFRSRLFRQLVYDSIPAARRTQIHLNVADRLSSSGHVSPAVVARHYELGGDFEEATRYSLLAGAHAGMLYAYDDARHYYEIADRCLKEIEGPRRWRWEAGLRIGMGRLYAESGDLDAAEVEAQAALEQAVSAGDTALQVEALNMLAELRLRRSQCEEAIGVADRAAQVAEAEGHAGGLAEALRLLGTIEYCNGRPQRAASFLKRSLALARGTDDLAQAYAALVTLGEMYAEQRRLQDALDARLEALEMARASGDPHRVAEMLMGVGELYLWRGMGPDAMAAYREATAVLAEGVDRVGLARALTGTASVLCFLGRYSRAEVLLGEAREVFEREGDAPGTAWCRLVWGREWARDAGDPKAARDEIATALPVLRGHEHGDLAIEALLALADLNLRLGDMDAASEILAELDELTLKAHRAWYRPEYEATLAKKALLSEDFEEAHRHALEALGAVGMGGDVRTLPLIYRLIAKALIAHGIEGIRDFDRVWDALERSVAAGKAQGRLYDLALSHYVLGVYLKTWGDKGNVRARGAGHLFAADRLFRQMGLEPPPDALRYIVP